MSEPNQFQKRNPHAEPMTIEQAVRRMYTEAVAVEATVEQVTKTARKLGIDVPAMPPEIAEMAARSAENKRVIQRLFQMMDRIPAATPDQMKEDMQWLTS